jgi:hypothetical protein
MRIVDHQVYESRLYVSELASVQNIFSLVWQKSENLLLRATNAVYGHGMSVEGFE